MVMHAWLRNTVMRLRFIKPRSQVAATEAGEEEKAKVRRAGLVERDDGAVPSHKELRDATRRDAVHRVDSVGTERRAGIVYCASSINPPPSPISSRTHPASPGLMQSANMSQEIELASASEKSTNVVRPRGVERLSVKSRHRAVSAKRGRVCFTNRGRVLVKNKRLSKRRGTTVREGDAMRRDATLEETYEAGGTRIATTEKGTRRRRPVEKEGRQVRQRTKAENDGL
ncbi:hypothetical protein G5I_01120 [Acromyrmex echinatior]|uniref:Uncharacterized protein n=1 Tax=Acromyrmex echinatior TaxID=103372 RepID=F4W6M5_ACREC|nr:hypothetical protein G5I_01120 [Acromyrmex echinatior]